MKREVKRGSEELMQTIDLCGSPPALPERAVSCPSPLLSRPILKYRLNPIGKGNEELCPIEACPDKVTVLGRNEITFKTTSGQNIRFVSRLHLQLFWEDQHLFMKVLTEKPNMVSVNGEVLSRGTVKPLIKDDTICLLQNVHCYTYKVQEVSSKTAAVVLDLTNLDEEKVANNNVHLNDTVEDCMQWTPCKRLKTVEFDPAPNAAVASDESQNTVGTNSGLSKELLSHMECAICLDVIAVARSVNPCGHMFCYSCLADWMKSHKDCPTCKSVISSTIPNPIQNQMIESILRTDEVMFHDWQSRVTEGNARKNADNNPVPKRRNEVIDLATPARRGIMIPPVAPPTNMMFTANGRNMTDYYPAMQVVDGRPGEYLYKAQVNNNGSPRCFVCGQLIALGYVMICFRNGKHIHSKCVRRFNVTQIHLRTQIHLHNVDVRGLNDLGSRQLIEDVPR